MAEVIQFLTPEQRHDERAWAVYRRADELAAHDHTAAGAEMLELAIGALASDAEAQGACRWIEDELGLAAIEQEGVIHGFRSWTKADYVQ